MAALVAIEAARRGRAIGCGGDWLVAGGVFLLAAMALGVPLMLAALGLAAGR